MPEDASEAEQQWWAMTAKQRAEFSAQARRQWRKDNADWVEFVDSERKRSGGVLPAGWEKRFQQGEGRWDEK